MSLLSSDTISFLGQLRANNDRQWFEAHRADYEAHLKLPGETIARALADELEAATKEPRIPYFQDSSRRALFEGQDSIQRSSSHQPDRERHQ